MHSSGSFSPYINIAHTHTNCRRDIEEAFNIVSVLEITCLTKPVHLHVTGISLDIYENIFFSKFCPFGPKQIHLKMPFSHCIVDYDNKGIQKR